MIGSFSEKSISESSDLLGEPFYRDFTRCQRPSGKIYGSRFKCRPPAVEIGAKVQTQVPAKDSGRKGVRIGKTVNNMDVESLEKLLKDPRVKTHQAKKIQDLIDKKRGDGDKITPKVKSSEELKRDGEREEYKNLLEKALQAVEVSKRIKSEMEAETGRVVTGVGPDWKEYKRRLKEEKLTPDKITALSWAVRDFRKTKGREWLNEELVASQVAKNTADWKAMSKAEKKAAIKARVEKLAKREKSIFEIDRDIKDWQAFNSSPELNTPENRTALIAMRALRAKLYAESRGEREASEASIQKFVEGSPKYKEAPGSSKPIKKMSSEEIAAGLRKAENDFVARAQKFDKEGKSFEAGLERDGAKDASRSADQFERGFSINPPLDMIYRMQGYNAKPEAVASRKDLEKRKDLVEGDDGKPLILWRGVTSVEFSDQFKGGGPRGDVHYPGKGIHGDGTYAASAAPGSSDRRSAFNEAKSYAGWGEEGVDKRMTAFAIRKDANIVQFSGSNPLERSEKFSAWQKEIREKAEKETGRVYHDSGAAAAALGIHAYRVPQGSKEDFWVILNRGALVVAADPQISEFL